ncbi:MAG: hypothetical protein RIC36_14925, partial [Rhodospirillales bacterium]
MPPFTPYWQGASPVSAAPTERSKARPRRSILTAPRGTEFILRDPARDFAWQPSGPLPDNGPADLSRIEMVIPENPTPRPGREGAHTRLPGMRTLEFRPGIDDVGLEVITRPFRPDGNAAGSEDVLRLNAGGRPAPPEEPAPERQPAEERPVPLPQAADRPATSAGDRSPGDRSPGSGTSPARPPDGVAPRQPDPATATPAVRDLSADPDIPSSAAAFLEALRTGELDEETLALPDNDLMPVTLPGGHTVLAGVARQLIRAATMKTEAERQALLKEMQENTDPLRRFDPEDGGFNLRFDEPASVAGIMPGVLRGDSFLNSGTAGAQADRLLAALGTDPEEMKQRLESLLRSGGISGKVEDALLSAITDSPDGEGGGLPSAAALLVAAWGGVRAGSKNRNPGSGKASGQAIKKADGTGWFSRDADLQRYREIRQRGYPEGMTADEPGQFSDVVTKHFGPDSRLAIRGSAVTGLKFNGQTDQYGVPVKDK